MHSVASKPWSTWRLQFAPNLSMITYVKIRETIPPRQVDEPLSWANNL